METLATVISEAFARMGRKPNTPCNLFVTPGGFIGTESMLTLYTQGEPVHNDHKRMK